ncbi:MAG TPA: hypothetical protein VK815_15910 [Candidatus Acidoferrales bacterium]|jgi:hypothetical protein|nr:hypothetical protein [Candidatus Acidoferrales bacterium]
MNENIHELAGGEVCLWTDDNASIHLKISNKFKDPVELNAKEARELGRLLLELADKID